MIYEVCFPLANSLEGKERFDLKVYQLERSHSKSDFFFFLS